MNDKTEYANVVTLPSKNILGKIKKDDYEVNLYAGKEIIDFLNNKSYIENDLNKYNAGKINMISGAFGAQKAYLTSILKNNNSTLIIVPEQKDIFLWNQDIKFFMPEKQVLFFPIMDKVNFEVTYSSTERLRDRVQSLAALYDNKDVVVIASVVEVMQKIPSKINVIQKTWTISLQDEIVRGRILNKLVDLGYERVDQVERVGHFSIRGDILDIFSINEENPIRIEFFGDVVDNIRYFNKDTQRSVSCLNKVTIFPVTIGMETDDSIFSYLNNSHLIFDEPSRCKEQLKKYFKEEKENKEKAFDWNYVINILNKKENIGKCTFFSLLKQKIEGIEIQSSFNWDGQTVTNYQRQIQIFIEDLRKLLERKWSVIVLAPSISIYKELQNLFSDFGINISKEIKNGEVYLTNGTISGGFEVPSSSFVVFSAGDIFGKHKKKRFAKFSQGKQVRYFSDLKVGDYVVQRSHGIGKYIGVNTIEIDGIHRDYVTIQYAGDDKLYLPMEKIRTLEKYIGPEGKVPTLNKMGGVQWERIRNKAKKSIKELAEKLLKVYAERQLAKGISFLPDSSEQIEFEDAFEYVETPDQLSATEKIKKSMESSTPMDMLLCGDVGFGKTEVAMRAVFKCVMSGYQSIVLCPTTVLASQHFKTFSERMNKFGVNVQLLNRFVKTSEKNKILSGFKSGQIDVLIGTHSVLSKSINCKRLGLLVVDEEQRFGVFQKEKWKSLTSGIDILTLSATPIPRTLHMSLSGVRDMAAITQAPQNRHAVQTYVIEYNEDIVKEAVLREKERNGQVYFVYNRIESIDMMKDRLEKIFKGKVRIGVAYGRMKGSELEKVMFDFYQDKYDLLLCTTLIENGLDQPNANTIIIYDADFMGLSQLYQMKGRVGRSDKIAKAYFFYRKDKVLSEVAEKRLNTIREFTELGSGFKIAMRDLEIRGAGNLLGSEQHGNIYSIGFSTYCNMLEEEVSKLRAKIYKTPIPKKIHHAMIEFRQEAYLDKNYIDNDNSKMEIYYRLSSVTSIEELNDFIDEVIDRYGTPTEPVKRLFKIAEMRIKASELGIGSIMDEGKTVLITWAAEECLKKINWMNLPKEILMKIHILPGSPARVRINKAAIQENITDWISEFIDKILKEIHR